MPPRNDGFSDAEAEAYRGIFLPSTLNWITFSLFTLWFVPDHTILFSIAVDVLNNNSLYDQPFLESIIAQASDQLSSAVAILTLTSTSHHGFPTYAICYCPYLVLR